MKWEQRKFTFNWKFPQSLLNPKAILGVYDFLLFLSDEHNWIYIDKYPDASKPNEYELKKEPPSTSI